MRGVMARVPVVEARVVREILAAALGMIEALPEIARQSSIRASATHRSCSAAISTRDTSIGWCCRKCGPCSFVVGLDRRPVLRERELEPHIAVDVTVGDMVDELAYRPAAFAIGSIELRVVEALDRGAKMLGQLAQRFDMCGSDARKRSWRARRKRPMG